MFPLNYDGNTMNTSNLVAAFESIVIAYNMKVNTGEQFWRDSNMHWYSAIDYVDSLVPWV